LSPLWVRRCRRGGGTPGVNDATSGPIATVILADYGAAFVFGMLALVRRRDVT
jgi:hypothetical protein